MVACGGCCANMVVVSHEIEEQAMNEERKIKRKNRKEEREGYRARWTAARWVVAGRRLQHGGLLCEVELTETNQKDKRT